MAPHESVNTATGPSAVKKKMKKISLGLKVELGLLPGPGLLLEPDQSSPENPKVSASPPCSRWWPEEPASPSAITGPSPSARSTPNSDPKNQIFYRLDCREPMEVTRQQHVSTLTPDPPIGSTTNHRSFQTILSKNKLHQNHKISKAIKSQN